MGGNCGITLFMVQLSRYPIAIMNFLNECAIDDDIINYQGWLGETSDLTSRGFLFFSHPNVEETGGNIR